MQAWSIERELMNLVGEESLEAALLRLGLLKEDSTDVVIEGDREWRRGGAETYIYRFQLVSKTGVRHLIMKAAVPFSLAQPLEEVVAGWLARRHLLKAEGVAVPQLFCSGKGLILEELIHATLVDELRYKPKQDLVDQVVSYAGILSKLRFSPVEAFDDLRTDGRSVFVIDFGQDLGPPGVAPESDEALYYRSIDWIRRHHQDSLTLDCERARSIFDYARKNPIIRGEM